MDFQQAANIPHDSASPETFPVWMITELDLESGVYIRSTISHFKFKMTNKLSKLQDVYSIDVIFVFWRTT